MKETKEVGITLIALVITIIVMLILAGVAINLTIGDNGIFKKSSEGAEIYKNETNNELENLNEADIVIGNLMEQYKGENEPEKPTPAPLPTPIEREIFTQNSTINGEKGTAFNPEVPKGFKPIDIDWAFWGDGTTPPTKEAIEAGLVIEDVEGNQFVWIAVDGENVKLDRYTFADNGTETAYGDDAIKTYFQELASSDKGNSVAKDINAFKKSVAEHGGYYFARYEASYGTDGKPNSKVSVKVNKTNGVAPTQEGQLWNNVTQPNAAIACRKMYDTSNGITSDLVNSYAWDTAIVFIQKYSEASNYSNQGALASGILNTGETGDERCHIHDMSSNCKEWTTETSTYYSSYSKVNCCCVDRGGNNGNGNYFFTSYRGVGSEVSTAYASIGFRPILYL